MKQPIHILLKVFLVTILMLVMSEVGWGQISQVGASTANASSGSDLSINKPTGVQVGDVMIMSIAKYSNGNTSNPTVGNDGTAGWTIIYSGALGGSPDHFGTIMYKVVTETWEPTSYTIIPSNWSTIDYAIASIVAYRGVDASTPFDATGTFVNPTGNGNTIIPTGITTTSNDALVLMLGISLRNNTNFGFRFSGWTATSPATLAEVFENRTTKVSVGAAASLKATPGATGNGSVTLSGNAPYRGGILLALKPAPPKQFRTKYTGDWTTLGLWEQSTDGGSTWVNATSIPTNSDGLVTIVAGHTITVPNGTNATASELSVFGTLTVVGNASITPGSATFNSGGAYRHERNGGTIPIATWDANSTCIIYGVTNTIPGGLSQSFGNFTWQCYGQSGNLSINNSLSCLGDFSVLSTNNLELRLANTATDRTLNVGGDFIISSGTFILNSSTGNGTTLNVTGDYNQSGGNFFICDNTGSGTFNLNGNYNQSGGIFDFYNGGNSTGQGTLNLGGNLNHSSATESMYTGGNGARNGIVNFVGSSQQTVYFQNVDGATWVTYNVPASNQVKLLSNFELMGSSTAVRYYADFIVDGLVDLGIYSITDGANQTNASHFVLNAGAKVITANATGLNGSLPSATMSLSFSSAADYEFQGATTGTFTTTPTAATVNDLIINNGSGVALSSNITVNGTLSLVDGILSTGANTLTVANNSTAAVSGASSTRFVNGPLIWQLATGQTYSFPVGNGTTYLPFDITGIAGTSPRLQVEAFTGNAGGTASGTLSSLSTTEYWQATISGGTYTDGSVSLTRQSALGTLNVIGQSATMSGNYTSLNGVVSGTSIVGSDNTGASLGYFVMGRKGPVLSCTPNNLDYGYIASGSSDIKTFALSGSNLDGTDVTITGNSTFQVSLNGSTFSSSVSISGYGSSISQTIYVLFGPTTTNTNYAHSITVGGGNASTQNVAVSGTSILSCTATGTILMEQWNGINGTTIANLTGIANYPANPSSSTQLNSFEIPTNTADNYGVRIRGYICAPTTGNYTFWIAADDNCELWLSTDSNPANKTRIAYHTNWTNSQEWNKYGTQKSAAISLVYGQSYYIEALMKEGTGGDNLAVGWAKPGEGTTTPSEVIPGTVLSPFLEPVTSIAVAPVSATILVGNTVTLTATVGPNNAADKSVIWSSSDNLIATVDASGIVTGVSAGNVTITATTVSGGLTANSSITVEAPPLQPSIITGSTTPCVGTTQTYSVTNVPGVTYAWVLPSGWSGSSTTNSISVTVGAASGDITVTPNNGYDGPSRSLAVTPGSSPDIITSPGSQCLYGTDVTVTVSASSTQSGTFTWYDSGYSEIKQETGSSSSHTVTISSDQTYYVVLDAGGCTTSYTPVIAHAIIPPTLNASAGGSFCVGSSINLYSDGVFSSVYWEGPNGYYSTVEDPVRTNATTAMSGTYTVNTSTLSGVNLVVNGDFERGNVGFTSSYTNSTDLVPEGRYAVVANPQSVHASFATCSDHSSGSGLQMVINGATTANVPIWIQTVNVVPGTYYQFSYWVQSVVGNNPSQLQLYINNVAAGPVYTAVTAACNWSQFFYNWDSGSATSAKLELRNQNIVAGGNDFSLDDIIFQHTCTATATVDVYVAASFTPSVTISPSPTVSVCSGNSVTFTATPLHGGPTPAYQWLLAGNPISGATSSTYTYSPTVAGSISCRMTSSLTSCLTAGTNPATSAATAVTVTDISPLTVVSITQPTCSVATGEVNLSGLPATGTWTLTQYLGATTSTSTGSGTTTTVTGLAEGTYNYTFTNSDGCTSQLSNNVIINPQPTTPAQPTIAASGATTFCAGGSVTLTSSAGTSYLWSTGEHTPSIVVTTSGDYTVQVTNADGCLSAASAATTVTVNPLPNASLTVPDVTVCLGDLTTFTLATTQSGVNYQLRLDSDDSNVGAAVTGDGGPKSFTATPNAVGTTTYNILATSNTNYCSVELTDKAVATVNYIDVAVTNTTSDADDCPDFLTPFNANTDAYNAGSTLVSFTVTRQYSTVAWNFSYELTGGAVNAASPETSATGSKSVAAGTSTYVFDFYITNTPGTAQTIQFNVTDAWDGNCTHTGTNQTVTHTILAMPVIGTFN